MLDTIRNIFELYNGKQIDTSIFEFKNIIPFIGTGFGIQSTKIIFLQRAAFFQYLN